MLTCWCTGGGWTTLKGPWVSGFSHSDSRQCVKVGAHGSRFACTVGTGIGSTSCAAKLRPLSADERESSFDLSTGALGGCIWARLFPRRCEITEGLFTKAAGTACLTSLNNLRSCVEGEVVCTCWSVMFLVDSLYLQLQLSS